MNKENFIKTMRRFIGLVDVEGRYKIIGIKRFYKQSNGELDVEFTIIAL